MKQYIITIIGAAILSSIAHIAAPSNWVKYVKIITGLVILSVILTPLASLTQIELFSDFAIDESQVDNSLYISTVASELEKRIEEDISERIRNEFSKHAEADADIGINSKNEITGVTHISICTDAEPENVKTRMNEVYGVEKNEVEVYEP